MKIYLQALHYVGLILIFKFKHHHNYIHYINLLVIDYLK